MQAGVNGHEDLFFACVRGDAGTVAKVLASGKASANAVELHTGQTALMKASYCATEGGTACVRALLAAGADAQQRDKHGGTALDWATSREPQAAATRAAISSAVGAVEADRAAAESAKAQPMTLPTSKGGPSFQFTLALEKVLVFGKGLSICPATILKSGLLQEVEGDGRDGSGGSGGMEDETAAAAEQSEGLGTLVPPELTAGTLVDVVMHAAGSGGVCTMGASVVALAAQHVAARAAVEAETQRRQQLRKAERAAKKAAKQAKSRKRKGLPPANVGMGDGGCGEILGEQEEGGRQKRSATEGVGGKKPVAAPRSTASATLAARTDASSQTGEAATSEAVEAAATMVRPLCTKTLHRALTRAGVLDDGAAKLLHCRAWLQPERNRRGVLVLHATHVDAVQLDSTCGRACETFALSRLLAARGDASVIGGSRSECGGAIGAMAAAEDVAAAADVGDEGVFETCGCATTACPSGQTAADTTGGAEMQVAAA